MLLPTAPRAQLIARDQPSPLGSFCYSEFKDSQSRFLGVQANLVYRVSVRATQRNLASERERERYEGHRWDVN